VSDYFGLAASQILRDGGKGRGGVGGRKGRRRGVIGLWREWGSGDMGTGSYMRKSVGG
jgi:hypothetical protein